ncbi:hypothetical protein [uncultured Akkermansia sp.]|uniref:hypothetical protein n=1 Tax=uncultured Akkermansia sp. TaxID=512294 RepID=UPI00263A2520|nr:hypothetical protein [uncultured Akkermansia sp.]
MSVRFPSPLLELCFSSCANPADGGPAAEGEESVLLRVADMAASAAYVMDFSLWREHSSGSSIRPAGVDMAEVLLVLRKNGLTRCLGR